MNSKNVKKEQPLLNKGTNREIDKPCDAEGRRGWATEETARNRRKENRKQQIFSAEMRQAIRKNKDEAKAKTKRERKQAANQEVYESTACGRSHDTKMLHKVEVPRELMNLGNRMPRPYTDHEPIEQPFPFRFSLKMGNVACDSSSTHDSGDTCATTSDVWTILTSDIAIR